MRTVPHKDMFKYLAVFNGERVVATSPRALAEILSRDYEFVKPSIMAKLGGPILGYGLLLSEGDVHKQQRKLVSPSFAVRHIKELIPIFWDKSRETVIKMTLMVRDESAKNAANTEKKEDQDVAVFEIGEWASRAALDIITLAALGEDFGAIEDPETELNRTYRTVFEPSRLFTLLALLKTVFPAFLVNALPIPRNGEMEIASKAIRRVCKSVIQSKKKKLEKDELNDKDIVSLVIKNGDIQNEEDIIDQMTTMLGAGHETVSVGMTWAVYMMCVQPKWQTILREEVRANLPSPNLDEKVSAEQIEAANMPFLNAFLSEILRYWPPVSMTSRVAAVDTEVLGWKIPKGTRFTLSMIANNRDETLWGDDAQTFRPERWLSEKKDGAKGDALGGATSKYAMMTFIHGHRSCIVSLIGPTFPDQELT
jgi:cytochrome P450